MQELDIRVSRCSGRAWVSAQRLEVALDQYIPHPVVSEPSDMSLCTATVSELDRKIYLIGFTAWLSFVWAISCMNQALLQ